MKRDFRRTCILLLGLSLAGCGPDPTTSTEAPSDTAALRITPLESPAPPDAGEPWLFADATDTYLSWIEESGVGAAMRFAVLERDGDGWSEPRTIVAGDDLMVNWADFPTLVALGDGTLAAHWLRRAGPRGYDYDVWMRLSRDGGASWNEPFKLHRDDVHAEHGFVSLVPGPGAELTAIWLDGRETVAPEGEEPGAMTLRATTVAADATLGEEHVLDTRICDCCQTDAARVGDRIVAVYRDRSPDEVRDIYAVAADEDGWEAPVRVAEDDWRIPGCPVNGPAIAARDGVAAVAWFALVDEEPRVQLAFTTDGARSFGAPIVVERGTAEQATLGRVDAGWIGERLLVTWLTDVAGVAEVRYAVFDATGAELERGLLGTTSPARASGFPRLAMSGDRGWVAWRSIGETTRIEMRRLAASAR